ncbi:MAG TPA: hypothetical protein VJL28_13945 [Gemmatimonadaceae bacterium]|nr:hypothetical protein [Gemmatimonadaceae bacterium]
MKYLMLPLAAALVIAACSEPTTPVAAARRGPNPNAPRLNVVGPAGFGPVDCLRETGKPVGVEWPFEAVAGPASLVVTGNGELGINGTIDLNGVTVVTHPMVGGNAPLSLTVPVTLVDGTNTLVCTLEGKPGSGVTLTVVP